MGEIFLARLEGAAGFGKLCVIKRILPGLSEAPSFITRFVDEAKTLVQLSHGAIAQVLDMGLVGNNPYLAMEYVDGKDLAKVAARARDRGAPLPTTVVLSIFSQVLDALGYVHRKRDEEDRDLNMVHRDVSPQNILVSYEGEVKVIDFGLAKSKLNVARTNPTMLLGKFLYMAPEQVRHHEVDRRCDLYAAGLCLYQLISGRHPFEDVPAAELMQRVLHPALAPLRSVAPDCPESVEQLVMKALAVDPVMRFQTAEEMRGRLLGCLLELDPSAGPFAVSRCLRELFANEYEQERRLLASFQVEKESAHSSGRKETDPQIPLALTGKGGGSLKSHTPGTERDEDDQSVATGLMEAVTGTSNVAGDSGLQTGDAPVDSESALRATADGDSQKNPLVTEIDLRGQTQVHDRPVQRPVMLYAAIAGFVLAGVVALWLLL